METFPTHSLFCKINYYLQVSLNMTYYVFSPNYWLMKFKFDKYMKYVVETV